MKNYKVGVIGATGMVGQRLVTLLSNHPWFHIEVLAASGKSAGKTYENAVSGRWAMESEIPENVREMVVLDAEKDAEGIASVVDFVFCAVNMDKSATKDLEEKYAKLECPVMSNNSANRGVSDVPMIIPEINPEHIEAVAAQKKRLGTKRGFISAKSNCSIQSYVPALHPLMKFGITKVLACTYQAISGPEKTLNAGRKWLITLFRISEEKKKKAKKNPLKSGEKSKTAKSSTPFPLLSQLNVFVFRFPTVIPPLFS